MTNTGNTPSKYPDKTDLGELYFFSTLDFLTSLVDTVADDFVKRPQLYKNLEEDIIDTLGRFFTQYGTELDLLAPRQRNVIRKASFGTSNTTNKNEPNSFHSLRDDLTKACSRYAANVRDKNERILFEEIETARVPFHDYLIGLQGSSASWGLARLSTVNERAYTVLRSNAVANVFGLAKAPMDTWPQEPDPIGNILVEEISEGNITRALFGQLQQVALNGQNAIGGILALGEQVSKVQTMLEEHKKLEEQEQVESQMELEEQKKLEKFLELTVIENCNRWQASLTKTRCTCQEIGLPNLGRI